MTAIGSRATELPAAKLGEADAVERADAHRRVRQLVGRSEISRLSERSDGPGLVFFAGHVIALLLTGSVIWLTQDTWLIVPAILLHGIVIVHLFGPFHEAAHRTAFRSAWLNKLVAWCAAIPLMLTPRYFRIEHAAHHAHTQEPGRDPQMIPMAERLGGYLFYASALPYFRGVLSVLLRRPFARFNAAERRVVPPSRLGEVQRETWYLWAVYLAVIAASIWSGSWAAIEYWLLPRVVAEPVMRLIRMSEHVGRPRVPDLLRNTRTVMSIAPVRWLAWNMAFHAEHHAVPGVPFHALPALHHILRPHLEDVQPGYVATQQQLIRNARRPSPA